MKKYITILFALFVVSTNAQEFKTNMATAKASYTSGKLEDAHFALQQMLQELDVTIGKEVLKLLPAKMDTLSAVTSNDNVMGNVAFVGATIHRTYGKGDKRAEIDIINNSPLIGTINAFLTSPLMGLASDGKSKVVKISGYKARLTREDNNDSEKPSYRLEMPFANALVTFTVNNTSEAEVLAMVNTVPFDKIAKLIQ